MVEVNNAALVLSYNYIAFTEENRTLRLKFMYMEWLQKLLSEDPEIKYPTVFATLTPSNAYST